MNFSSKVQREALYPFPAKLVFLRLHSQNPAFKAILYIVVILHYIADLNNFEH